MFVDKKTMGGFHQLGTKVPQLHILFAGREYWFVSLLYDVDVVVFFLGCYGYHGGDYKMMGMA